MASRALGDCLNGKPEAKLVPVTVRSPIAHGPAVGNSSMRGLISDPAFAVSPCS
jgi:hypothetical protein